MTMAALAETQADSPGQRNPVIERLVGETAEPQKVIAAARMLGERALPLIAKSLTDMLAVAVEFELEDVVLGRIADVFAEGGVAEPLTVASSSNSPDALMISMDADAVSMVTALLFGAGPETALAPVERPLSNVERRLCATTFQKVAEALNGTGARAMNVRFPLPAPILGEDRRKQIFRDGPSARLVFRLTTSGAQARVHVTMPQRVVLTPRGDDGKSGGDWKARFGGEVMRSLVSLQATIPIGKLTLGEISGLAVGQVLEMPVEAPGDTRLAAKDKTLFVCEFGKLGQNYTVRIKHAFDPEADLMNGLLAG